MQWGFGFEASQKHDMGGMGKVFLGGTQANPIFDDSNNYYRAEQPYNSVVVPKVGVRFSLLNTSPDGSAVQLMVHYTRPQELAPLKTLRFY